MVCVIPADIVQIILLASYTHAFLGIDSTGIRPVIGAQEYIFELHHTRIGKEQGLVPARHKRSGRNNRMSLRNKKVDEFLSDLGTGAHYLYFSIKRFNA
jgi:hypothetical protein